MLKRKRSCRFSEKTTKFANDLPTADKALTQVLWRMKQDGGMRVADHGRPFLIQL